MEHRPGLRRKTAVLWDAVEQRKLREISASRGGVRGSSDEGSGVYLAVLGAAEAALARSEAATREADARHATELGGVKMELELERAKSSRNEQQREGDERTSAAAAHAAEAAAAALASASALSCEAAIEAARDLPYVSASFKGANTSGSISVLGGCTL